MFGVGVEGSYSIGEVPHTCYMWYSLLRDLLLLLLLLIIDIDAVVGCMMMGMVVIVIVIVFMIPCMHLTL